MDEQLDLFSAIDEEISFWQYIKPYLIEVLDSNMIPHHHLTGRKNKGYYSVQYRNSNVFSYKFRKNTNYISFPIRFNNHIPHDLGESQKIKNSHIYVYFESSEAARSAVGCLISVLDYAIDLYPTAFSCCSRYEACSNAGHCIHPDNEFALDCYYKINLKHGKIFYGINAIQDIHK